ncbi:MAG TPA: N-acetyltransferase [Croceibacterium sp.]|nr:N-acetyltransferase [Croceibacterium sp.]
MNVWTIRRERDGDEAAIAHVIATAFAGEERSDGSEAGIVDRLRDSLELESSYVAVTPSGNVVGHIAFSPVTIDGVERGWYGLGPLAVLPDWQRRGIGAALVEAGIEDLQRLDAAGCVVLGEPGYYARFGFAHVPALTYPAASVPEYFQRLVLDGEPPRGVVSYSPAFG